MRTGGSVAEATEVCGREEGQEEVLGVIGFVYIFKACV